MTVLTRALRRPWFLRSMSFDERLSLLLIGLGVVGLLAIVEQATTRDGLAVFQRYGTAGLSLVVWQAVFRVMPSRHDWRRHTDQHATFGAVVGIVVIGIASLLIARQAGGQAWGSLLLAAVAYVVLCSVAVLRKGPISYALPIFAVIQVGASGFAFLVFPSSMTIPMAATIALVLGALLVGNASRIQGRPGAWLTDAASTISGLRPAFPYIALAALSSVALSLVIGGQTGALSRFLVPLTGLVASRLVAEEILLRVWLLTGLERRIGATASLVATALLSGITAWLARGGGPTLTSAASAFVAALAAGILWRKTGSPSSVVLFRLVVP